MPRTPAEAWTRIQEGNARFADGYAAHPDQSVSRRQELTQRQNPFVTVFHCGDSRIPAEIIMDLGLGDVFVVRNASQVVNDDAIGSIEYGVGPLAVPLLLVVTHSGCGAVRAAIDSQAKGAAPLPEHIAHLIEPIIPSVHKVAGTTPGTPINAADIDAAEVGRVHLHQTIADLQAGSEMIAEAVSTGRMAIVGAIYHLDSGRLIAETTVGAL